MRKRITILLILATICILINPKIVMADSPGFDVSYGSSPATGGDSESTDLCEGTPPAGTKTWSGVNYPITTYYRSKVQMDTYEYDYKTNSYKLVNTILGNDGKLYAGTYKAGTFVGIDYYEEYESDATVNIVPYCVTRSVTISCEREYTYHCKCGNGNKLKPVNYTEQVQMVTPDDDIGGNDSCTCHGTEKRNAPEGGTCADLGGGWEQTGISCSVNNCSVAAANYGNVEETAKNILKSYTTNMDNNRGTYASYTANRNNVNDIKDKTPVLVEPYSYITSGPIEPATNGYGFHQIIKLQFKYNPKKTCMNTIDGTVRYIDFDKNCDSSKERSVDYSINQPGSIGLYFIPLNAKTGNDVMKYSMEANRKQSKEMCTALINKYSSDGRWKYMIVDVNKLPFYMNTSISEGLARVEHGCYFQTTIYFGVNQEFYNETTAKQLEGYGVYFRPIDINNPFPNGISTGSVWEYAYNPNKNTISVKDSNGLIKPVKLNESYMKKELMYKAEYDNKSNSVNAIKEYNKDHSYTDWADMNANGRSNFITNNYVKEIGIRDFYKLGCGPTNANWKECQ